VVLNQRVFIITLFLIVNSFSYILTHNCYFKIVVTYTFFKDLEFVMHLNLPFWDEWLQNSESHSSWQMGTTLNTTKRNSSPQTIIWEALTYGIQTNNTVFSIFWVRHVIGKSDQHFGGTCCHLLQHQSSSKTSVIFNTLRLEYDILFIKMTVQ
jgi:hypothetical protein